MKKQKKRFKKIKKSHSTYTITKEDIQAIDEKHYHQMKFMARTVIDRDARQIKYVSNAYSATLNPKKYSAEVSNRVNSIHKICKSLDLIPIFITLTLPSKYHKIDRRGDLIISPRDSAKELSLAWTKFLRLKVFNRFKEQTGFTMPFIKVFEPHKSGVPHVHVLCYVPKEFVHPIRKKFFEHFRKKGFKRIDFRYTWDSTRGGAISYIMKYILKTFKNPDSKKIDYISYWYVKYNIRRFTTSRKLLAPLYLYRKCRWYFKSMKDDYILFTEMLNNNRIFTQFDRDYIIFRKCIYEEVDNGIKAFDHIEEFIIYQKDPEYMKKDIPMQSYNIKYEKKEVVAHSFQSHDYTGMDTYIVESSNRWNGIPITPSKMKDIQLEAYYNKLNDADLGQMNLQHYYITKNEMIKRGLLDEDLISCNIFSLIKHDENLEHDVIETEVNEYGF